MLFLFLYLEKIYFKGLNFIVVDIFFCFGILLLVFLYCFFRMFRLVVFGVLVFMVFGMNFGGLNLGVSKLIVIKFC